MILLLAGDPFFDQLFIQFRSVSRTDLFHHFGRPKCPSILKRSVSEPFSIFTGPRNAPLGPPFSAKKRKNRFRRTTLGFPVPPGTRPAIQNGPGSHFSRFYFVWAPFWDPFGSLSFPCGALFLSLAYPFAPYT